MENEERELDQVDEQIRRRAVVGDQLPDEEEFLRRHVEVDLRDWLARVIVRVPLRAIFGDRLSDHVDCTGWALAADILSTQAPQFATHARVAIEVPGVPRGTLESPTSSVRCSLLQSLAIIEHLDLESAVVRLAELARHPLPPQCFDWHEQLHQQFARARIQRLLEDSTYAPRAVLRRLLEEPHLTASAEWLAREDAGFFELMLMTMENSGLSEREVKAIERAVERASASTKRRRAEAHRASRVVRASSMDASAALRVLVSWAENHQARFWGRGVSDPMQEAVAGRWDAHGWQFLAVEPETLTFVLGQAGFDADHATAEWHKRGWIRTVEGRPRWLVRVGERRRWLVAVEREAVLQATVRHGAGDGTAPNAATG